jgi:hypothetical protein
MITMPAEREAMIRNRCEKPQKKNIYMGKEGRETIGSSPVGVQTNKTILQRDGILILINL